MCSVISIPPASSGTWRVSSVSTASRRHRRHPHHPRVRVVLPRPNRLLRLPHPFPDIDTFVWRNGNGLGITVGDLSEQLAGYFGIKDGVLVTSVADDSAAAKAGIKAGDVITSFNGTDVTQPSDLRRRIQRLENGDEFTVGCDARQEAADAERQGETLRSRRTLPRRDLSRSRYTASARACARVEGGPTSVASWAATIEAAASFAGSFSPSSPHFSGHHADTSGRA